MATRTANELQVKAVTALEQWRTLHRSIEDQDRAPNVDEKATLERMWQDWKDLEERATAMARAEEATAKMEKRADVAAAATLPAATGVGGDGATADSFRSSKEYAEACRTLWVYGPPELTPDQRRALALGQDTAGGYLVPTAMASELIQALDDKLWLRGLARKRQIPNAKSIGIPSLDTDPTDATWTSEVATGAEDTAMKFGGREMIPHPLAKRLKISKKLLATAPDVDSIVRERLVYRVLYPEENAFLNGTGVDQPLGVFVANAQGVTTARDYSTGNTTTGITYTGLMGAKYHLKSPYWANAKWLFHRTLVKQVALLLDGVNRPLWQPSLIAGEPALLLDFPVLTSELAPSTIATSAYVGMLADWSFYQICDAMDIAIQVLYELYAETNQNGYIIRKETDGAPILAEAFVRVQLAAS